MFTKDGESVIVQKMSSRQFPDTSKESDPTIAWEQWAEEAFPDEEPQVDRLRMSSISYVRNQDKLTYRRQKGTKAVPPNIPSAIVDVVSEAEPAARETLQDSLLDDIQSIAEA